MHKHTQIHTQIWTGMGIFAPSRLSSVVLLLQTLPFEVVSAHCFPHVMAHTWAHCLALSPSVFLWAVKGF